MGSISKTTTLHVHHVFFGTFLCRFCMTITCKCRISRWQDVNTRQRLSFSFRDLRYNPLEFNSRNVHQHLTNWTRWDKRDKVWSGANSLSKWRFCNHRSRCCFSLGELESSKIFAERALQVARVGFELLGYSRALGTAGSIMTIGLSINACWHSKSQFDEIKRDWLVQKIGLWSLQRLDTIQAELPFLFLDQKEDKKGLCSQGNADGTNRNK